MTQVTTTTAIKTTVILEFISAAIIRMVAKVDMPEYNLTAGQVFYCAYSTSESAEQGKNVYHILTWNYTEMRWACPCKAVCHNCKHVKAASRDCSRQHSAALQGYKPKYDAVREANEFIARIQREKAAKAAADWQAQGFSPRDEGYYNAKFARDAEMQAAYSRQLERESARGSLASSNRHMEMAPSGTWVPMR